MYQRQLLYVVYNSKQLQQNIKDISIITKKNVTTLSIKNTTHLTITTMICNVRKVKTTFINSTRYYYRNN